jgi:CxxC motif-containing protein (DUF1111 family)
MIDGSRHFETSGNLARRGGKAMRALRSKTQHSARLGACFALVWAWAWGAIADPSWAGTDETPSRAQVTEGLRLFLTDWSSVNRGGEGGDGLGPVFNERSCVACHNQGGAGGAGGSRFNVLILTDASSPRGPDGAITAPKPEDAQVAGKPFTSRVFPGFATERSLVMHRYSKDQGYELWRSNVIKTFRNSGGQGDDGSQFRVIESSRNTPALFGAGLIDAIPDSALEAASLRVLAAFPEIKGRPAHLKDGRVGRFGWKAQTATLGDFVRTACANELGLENPGHPQSPDPFRPNYKAPGVDLTDAECTSLTSFVAALPPPVESRKVSFLKEEQIALGREVFSSIGCAACHMPKLGDVEGIYSDLLLHDLGQGLSDSGEYYGNPAGLPGLASAVPRGNEWRTPPLWGLHDSAPYLHDGRAVTIPAAIELHGGEADLTIGRYKKLVGDNKRNLNDFLLSLTAPPSTEPKPNSRSRPR